MPVITRPLIGFFVAWEPPFAKQGRWKPFAGSITKWWWMPVSWPVKQAFPTLALFHPPAQIPSPDYPMPAPRGKWKTLFAAWNLIG